MTPIMLSSALLLLSLCAPILAEVCPADEAISPCMCDDNDLDYDIVVWCTDGAQPELKRAFDNLRGKKNLAVELAFLVLGGLPSNFFKDIQVKKLTVTNSELEGLEGVEGKPALLGLEDSLEEIGIYNSLGKYKKQLSINLGHLRRLTRLELGDNNIEEIGNDWFQNGPVSLVELVLSNNNIQILGDRAFHSLTNLKYLVLDGNRFNTLHRNMFPRPANMLFSLDLSNNEISELPEDIFREMPSLKEVILNTNSIHTLPASTWKIVWEQLEYVYIENNPLQCDANMDWIHETNSNVEVDGYCEGPIGKEGLQVKNALI